MLIAEQGLHLRYSHVVQLNKPLPLWDFLTDQQGIDAFDVAENNQLLKRGVIPHVTFSFRIFFAPLEVVPIVRTGDSGLLACLFPYQAAFKRPP
jgi:hypothetical protein